MASWTPGRIKQNSLNWSQGGALCCHGNDSRKKITNPTKNSTRFIQPRNSHLALTCVLGNSSYSEDIFKIHKRMIRIIMNSSRNGSCRQLFEDLNILPIQSQYIYLIRLFVTKNKDQFLSNSQVHKINTRQTSDLFVPTANLTIYQKCFYYSGIKIYNHLPTAIKDLSCDKNKFKLALKRCLLHNSFYSLEEYFNT